MPQPKELYRGKCLEDLAKLYKLPDVRGKNLKMLCTTVNRLHEAAEKNLKEGDEEQAYIFYMKYFNMIQIIQKMPEYSLNRQYYMSLLGSGTKVNRTLDTTENLSTRLKERYKKLHNTDEFDDHLNNAIRNLPNTPDVEELTSLETSITPFELYQRLQDPTCSMLLMDCRPRSDYQVSQLKTRTLNVPEEILISGMTAGKIQQELDDENRARWASRFVKEHIVLIDWCSNGLQPKHGTPVWLLKDILLNWDPDVAYKNPILMLDGGYERFVLMYPMLSTNPNVTAPLVFNWDKQDTLDDIEYPSFNDIVMKDDAIVDLFPSPLRRPMVNRSSKAFAIKRYQSKSEVPVEVPVKLQDILEHQEELAEKSLQNEQQILEAESNWEKLRVQQENDQVEEEKLKLLAREQELLYNILQLENNQRDYQMKNEQLREELRAYKSREKQIELQHGIRISEQEALMLENAAAKRIAEKEEECAEIDKKREFLANEREKKLALAREAKRHISQEAQVEDFMDIITSPQSNLPQFDRTTKPLNPGVNDTPVATRDFGPTFGCIARGLTGLRNLGNTCYMNSILQCLSNANSLAEYLMSGIFKKHLNRESQTRGLIVEEVAAVFRALWDGQYKSISTRELKSMIGQCHEMFRGYEQQDSHEFLTILMDWLHLDLQTIRINLSANIRLSASEKSWHEFTNSRESYILRLFYGQIKSTVKCIQCSKESATYESFSNLSLELPASNRCVMQNCLDMYFNGEKIHGWNCPNCKQKRDAVKKLDVSKLPPILIIHFKRFYADADSLSASTYKKRQSYVQFPMEDLDMAPYVARSEIHANRRNEYNLYAVSNHYGSMESGHYTAFCKSSVMGKWYKYDDHMVSQMDNSDVISSAAYILFYTTLPITPPTA